MERRRVKREEIEEASIAACPSCVGGGRGANSNDGKNYCLFFNANEGKIVWYFLLWSATFL
jgi:hypothetical protein